MVDSVEVACMRWQLYNANSSGFGKPYVGLVFVYLFIYEYVGLKCNLFSSL